MVLCLAFGVQLERKLIIEVAYEISRTALPKAYLYRILRFG